MQSWFSAGIKPFTSLEILTSSINENHFIRVKTDFLAISVECLQN